MQQYRNSHAFGEQWLFDNDLWTPQMINAILLNCFMQDKSIKDIQFDLDYKNKNITFYLYLTKIKLLLKNKYKLSKKILNILFEVLPNYNINVQYKVFKKDN